MATIQEYLNEIAKTAELDEASKAALTKILENKKFVEELDNGVKRQSDYSRYMNELKDKETKVDQTIQSWREWYNTAVETDAARERELQELRAKGNGSPNPNPAPVVTGITAKQLEEAQGRMVQIIKQMGRISSRHAADFHEALDVDAVEKIAIDKGLTVDKAYEDYVAPRIHERTQKELEEKIKLAHEEGVREGMSKRDVPGEGEKTHHLIFGHSKQVEVAGKLTDAQRRDGFMEAWNTAKK